MMKRGVVLSLLVLPLSGCISMPEPWVKPYERQRLADPIMKANRSAVIGKYRVHVNEVREAARGGQTVTGGGCGCN